MALTPLSLAGDTAVPTPATFGIQITLINAIVAILNAQLTSEILATLTTTDTSTLVGAVNELDAKQVPIRMSSGTRKGITLFEIAEI